MFANVLFMLDELVAQELFEMSADALQARDAVDYVTRDVKSIQIVQNRHIEGSSGCSFFLVSADMEIVMIGTPISKAVNQPGITVIGKDDWLVGREDRVELMIGEAVRMFS